MYGINGIPQQSDYAETKKEVLLRWRLKALYPILYFPNYAQMNLYIPHDASKRPLQMAP